MTGPLPNSLNPAVAQRFGLDPMLAGHQHLDQEERLQAYRDWLEAELRRTAEALRIMRAERDKWRTSTRVGRPHGTWHMIRRYYREHPGEDLTAAPMVPWMFANGWVTDTPNPEMTVRTALAKMAATGELVRVTGGNRKARGAYRPAGEPGPSG